MDFRIVLQRAICCRKPVRQLQSIAGCDAARLDLGKGLWACASPTHYKAVAMMLAHSGTAQPKARKQGCQRAVPLDCGYAYSWPPGAAEAEACLHSRSIRVSKQSLCCLG